MQGQAHENIRLMQAAVRLGKIYDRLEIT